MNHLKYWLTFPFRLAVVFCCAVVLLLGIAILSVLNHEV